MLPALFLLVTIPPVVWQLHEIQTLTFQFCMWKCATDGACHGFAWIGNECRLGQVHPENAGGADVKAGMRLYVRHEVRQELTEALATAKKQEIFEAEILQAGGATFWKSKINGTADEATIICENFGGKLFYPYPEAQWEAILTFLDQSEEYWLGLKMTELRLCGMHSEVNCTNRLRWYDGSTFLQAPPTHHINVNDPFETLRLKVDSGYILDYPPFVKFMFACQF